MKRPTVSSENRNDSVPTESAQTDARIDGIVMFFMTRMFSPTSAINQTPTRSYSHHDIPHPSQTIDIMYLRIDVASSTHGYPFSSYRNLRSSETSTPPYPEYILRSILAQMNKTYNDFGIGSKGSFADSTWTNRSP